MKDPRCRIVLVYMALAMITQDQAQESLRAYYTKVSKGESWEKESRTTEHADIIVELNTGKLLFWRGTSYLPVWETEKGSWTVDEMIERKGDGPDSRPDDHNTFSSVRIIESGAQRVWINWRYLPRFTAGNPKGNVDHLNFVEEDFIIYPDGKVNRTFRQGTPKIDDWLHDRNTLKQSLNLTEQGIIHEEIQAMEATSSPSRITGNPILETITGSPVLSFKFDRGGGDEVIETLTSGQYLIEGGKIGAPVSGGDSLLLRTGSHGRVTI